MNTPVKQKSLHEKPETNAKTTETFTSVLKMTKAAKKIKSTKKILRKFKYARRVSLELFRPDFTSTPNSEQPKTSTPNLKWSTPKIQPLQYQAKSLNIDNYRHFFYDNNLNQNKCQSNHLHHNHHHHHNQQQNKLRSHRHHNQQLCRNSAFTPSIYGTCKTRQSSFIIINRQSYLHEKAQLTEIRQTKLFFY
jgi:hypothetical protein